MAYSLANLVLERVHFFPHPLPLFGYKLMCILVASMYGVLAVLVMHKQMVRYGCA